MTGSAQDADGALVRSLAAVWKSYLDQAVGSPRGDDPTVGEAIRRGPSTMWEAHRQNLALGIAWFLTDIAGRPFARLYKTSLLEEHAGAGDR